MDSIKKFGEKTKKSFNDVIDYSAKKISESGSFSIQNIQDLEKLINSSETTEFLNKETGELKYFKHKSILIIVDKKTDFYKKISLLLPILKTKAYSQNINIMLSSSELEGINYKELYNLDKFPSMIIFEDKKIYKEIFGEENIEKIAKSVKINIEEQIEQF